MQAAASCGRNTLDCGVLPTPALALEAIGRRLPAVIVTGSHIPDDRNGLKFHSPTGEITKEDENDIQLAHATASGSKTEVARGIWTLRTSGISA